MNAVIFDISAVRNHIYGQLAELPAVQSMPWAPYIPKLEFPSCPEALYRALDIKFSDEACRLIHDRGQYCEVGDVYQINDALSWNAVVERGVEAKDWEKRAVNEMWDRMIVAVIKRKVSGMSGLLAGMSPNLWVNMDDFCDQFIRMLQSDIESGILCLQGEMGLKFDLDGKQTWPVISHWNLEFRQENGRFAPHRLLAEDLPGPLFA